MVEFQEKYINPFTDFGFKRIFGQEYNKDLLIDFLNSILNRENDPILNIMYGNTEQLPITNSDRRAVFDIYCESSKGEKFIVEMQKSIQTYFKDRTLFYASYPIIRQAQKGDWNHKLDSVYVVAILDFEFSNNTDDTKDGVIHTVKLVELETKEVFYDKLCFVYAEMPKFNKKLEELQTNTEKWLYVLKNISYLNRLPDKLKNKIFEKVFEEAYLANFTAQEYQDYQMSLKTYRDNKAVLETALEQGRKEGLEQGKKEEREENIKNSIQSLRALSLNESQIVSYLMRAFALNEQDAKGAMYKYLKLAKR